MTTLDYQVGASPDDLYWTGTSFDRTTTTMPIGRATNVYNTVARFADVTIPDDATIDAAYLLVYFDSSEGSPEATIKFEDAADPGQITSYTDGNSRVLTTTGVAYNPPTSGTWNNTPSIISIVEELMGSYSYADGAAMQCIIVGGGASGVNRTYVRTYNYRGNTSGPKLHIEYSVGAVAGYVHSQCIII